MRWTTTLLLAVSLAALGARTAHAHGGSYSGRWGPRPAPSIPCDCARVDCPHCSSSTLGSGAGLKSRTIRVEILERWGDLAHIRTTTKLIAAEQLPMREAYVALTPAPLFAVTGGSVTINGQTLHGGLAASQGARRDYLWERRGGWRDPMLVLPDGAGGVHVRVFPVFPGTPAVAVVEGYALLCRPAPTEPALYRSGAQCLLVRPLTEEVAKEADFIDRDGKRALTFVGEWLCRQRFPRQFATVVDVPCVHALLDAVRGKGDQAVTHATALVALEAGSRAPTNLFVGPASQAPMLPGSNMVPPGLREPSDPAPPPPPPNDVARTPTAGGASSEESG